MKKNTIGFEPNPNDIIAKVPKTQLKKGEIVKIPKNYDAILMYRDGTQEVIQNILEITLEYPVEMIYLVLHNRQTLETKWGTPTRILIEDELQQSQLLGAYGTIEFQMQNASRFITTRMGQETVTNYDALKHHVLVLIPEAFNQYFATIQSIQTEDPAKLSIDLKHQLSPYLETLLDDLGLRLKSMVIENVNFQRPEGVVS